MKINSEMRVPANSTTDLKLSSNVAFPKGLFSFPVEIFFVGFPKPLIIMVNGEGF